MMEATGRKAAVLHFLVDGLQSPDLKLSGAVGRSNLDAVAHALSLSWPTARARWSCLGNSNVNSRSRASISSSSFLAICEGMAGSPVLSCSNHYREMSRMAQAPSLAAAG